MEILKILEESGKDLYIEDLDFFETELATGGIYNAAYQAQCKSKIKELRSWLSGDIPDTSHDKTPDKVDPVTPSGTDVHKGFGKHTAV